MAGRIAIITGAAGGLGRDIAVELAPRCAGLLLVDRAESGLAETAARVTGSGRPVVTHVADLTDSDAAEKVVAVAEERFGGADALVNNAGIVEYEEFLATSPALLRRLLAVDVEAVYRMTQAFVGSLRARGDGGAVVNLGTGHALSGVGGTSAYAAAKGAVHALTRALAVELAPFGIRVTTLALGTTMTDRVRNDLPAGLIERRMAQIPLGRGAEPAEAARAVAYLLDAEYATGTELVLDGGFTVFGDR
ncbi:SDR family oxidoreductase [Pseudonocardia kujensis]|uniref:SDR family NAD(P)-dependent oxidoreductase n=1 Tax=Pseudonocardia kujensis TaxID=1128675 RepID=UPI001E653864|nr:SDR family oxidoreductase [Pseudonocardia kujensis]MCE0765591.1 SDR family oxidoreductase [Pseudonocardia kujensis]